MEKSVSDETDSVDDGAPEDEGLVEDLERIDQRFLVNEILFKGLVTLLVERRVFSRDEITAHLLDVPDFRKLHQWRPDALPTFEQALSFLWKD